MKGYGQVRYDNNYWINLAKKNVEFVSGWSRDWNREPTSPRVKVAQEMTMLANEVLNEEMDEVCMD